MIERGILERRRCDINSPVEESNNAALQASIIAGLSIHGLTAATTQCRHSGGALIESFFVLD
jgi:hypothetical protein